MSSVSSREAFESALAEGSLDPTVIEGLVRSHTPEDLFLDYKSGKIVSECNAAKIRSEVAGFANAEGGLTLLGVRGGDVTPASTRWRVDGCPDPVVGRETLLDWITNSLRELAPYLHPYPKIGVVKVRNRRVVFIATARSNVLVPCIEKNKGIVHYLRFHGQTYPSPSYLMADLLLGRRQRPVFLAGPEFDPKESAETLHLPRRPERPTVEKTVDVTFEIPIRNASPVWANEPIGGLIGTGLRRKGQAVPPELLAYVDHSDGVAQVVSLLSDSKVVRPFQSAASFEATVSLPAEISHYTDAYRRAESDFYGMRGRTPRVTVKLVWRGALYVLCREAPPEWFQVDLDYPLLGQDFALDPPKRGRVSRPSRLPAAGLYAWGRHLGSGDWVCLGSDVSKIAELVTPRPP